MPIEKFTSGYIAQIVLNKRNRESETIKELCKCLYLFLSKHLIHKPVHYSQLIFNRYITLQVTFVIMNPLQTLKIRIVIQWKLHESCRKCLHFINGKPQIA